MEQRKSDRLLLIGVIVLFTVGNTMSMAVVERTRETVYAVFVVHPVKHTLIHAVPLRRLISGDPHANVLTAAPARRPVR